MLHDNIVWPESSSSRLKQPEDLLWLSAWWLANSNECVWVCVWLCVCFCPELLL